MPQPVAEYRLTTTPFGLTHLDSVVELALPAGRVSNLLSKKLKPFPLLLALLAQVLIGQPNRVVKVLLGEHALPNSINSKPFDFILGQNGICMASCPFGGLSSHPEDDFSDLTAWVIRAVPHRLHRMIPVMMSSLRTSRDELLQHPWQPASLGPAEGA